MLGDNIKELMKNKKISSKELADIIGVTATHVSYIINDKRDPSMDLLNKIASALDVSVATLCSEQGFEYVGGKLVKKTIITNKYLTEDAIKENEPSVGSEPLFATLTPDEQDKVRKEYLEKSEAWGKEVKKEVELIKADPDLFMQMTKIKDLPESEQLKIREYIDFIIQKNTDKE